MTTNDQIEPLQGIMRDTVAELMRATGTASLCITGTGPGQLILAGEAAQLRRVLGMREAADLQQEAAALSAITGAARIWLGLNGAGQVAMFFTKQEHAEQHPELRIVEYVCTPVVAAP